MFMILNASDDIVGIGWVGRDGEVHELCVWPTLEEAEHALTLIRDHSLAVELEHREGMRVVHYPDA